MVLKGVYKLKAAILAGGFGMRIREKLDDKPKAMVEIGDKPILWHIMKIYSCYGLNNFIVYLGYKGNYIKEYFSQYFLNESDLTIDLHTSSAAVNTGKPV